MNTTQLIQQKVKEGKLKMGECDRHDCKNFEYLFKVRENFICSDCLDKMEKLMKELGL